MLTKKYANPECAAQWKHTHVTSSITEAPQNPSGSQPPREAVILISSTID